MQIDFFTEMVKIQEFIYRVGVFGERQISFSDGMNLLYSSENSKGKTTLLRMLLWALGYNIPDTKGIRLDDMQFELLVINAEGHSCVICRKFENAEDVLSIDINGELIFRGDFITNRRNIQRSVFCLENELLLDNLLCSFYIDQEKGWTVLNRGKVVGGIQFAVELFLCGLGDEDVADLRRDYAKICSDLYQYKKLHQFASLTAEQSRINGDLLRSDATEERQKEEAEIDVNISYINGELEFLKKIYRENKSLSVLIDKLKIRVRTQDGDEIRVTHDNIVDFNDNIIFLRSRITLLEAELDSLVKRKKEIRKTVFDEDALYSSTELLDVYKTRIKNVHLNQSAIQDAIASLEYRKNEINRRIVEMAHNSWETVLERFIRGYLTRLAVKNEYSMNERVALTHKLSLYSGAEMSKRVLAFRFGYLKCLEQKFGLKLPLIIDSPYSKEIDGANFNKMMDIIKEDFCDYQVIIASIHDENMPRPYQKITIHEGIWESEVSYAILAAEESE